MDRTATIGIVLSAFALTLAGCSWSLGSWGSKPKLVDPNLYPTNYKHEILDTMRHVLSDPTHVRGGMISAPVLTQVGHDQRYTACVRTDERNASGEYPGPRNRIAYFYSGHLNQLVPTSGNQCANAAYIPFPELDKLCYVKKCP